ncbi:hypothetical protein EV421DRAFT_1783447 [Armillaria borealis]|uniref:Uncharacterized protein n=1 Tax=Armillaria borealis TaxID=47425 RepID=A0AA39MVI9_9AGAR|nr:hypothetical protein EV421DRAFT_1783447 [Armillaria borealis]
MNPGSLLPLSFVAALSSFIVAAQDDHYAALNNKQGQTPCELVEEMERCPQARAVRWDIVFGEQGASRPQHLQHGEPSPNWCTCTNVFFNIWSACLMSQGNYSLTSDQWQNQCEQQKLRISTSKRSVEDQDHVPMWAYAEMPVNQTFNIRQAADCKQAFSEHILYLLFLAAEDSEDQSSSWSRYQIITIVAISCSVLGVAAILLFLYRWRSLWARHHWLRSDSRDNNWAIDDEVEALEDYQYVATPSTSRHGHIRLSSTPTPYDGPARRTWYIRSQDFFRKTRNKFLDISEYIPRPWRTKPVHSQRPDSTLENYRTAGKQVYAAQTEPGPHRIFPYISNNGEDQPGFEADSEQERLITPSEEFPEPPPSVLLISQGGRDFTLESGESRSQQHHAVSHEGEVPQIPPGVKHQPILRPPPAPTYPAPLPPLSPPRSMQQRLRKLSSDNMLGLHTGPAPSRDGAAYPTPMASSSHLPIHPPSPLFIHRSSIEALQNASTSHFRLPSDPTTHSALASTENMPSNNYSDDDLPLISSPPYHASPLRDERILTPPPPNTPPPPLTPPHLMSTPMSIRPLPLPDSSLAPLTRTHQRNLSSESVIPARTDPVMLFSGAVRAAGYMTSTDSLGRASPDSHK